MRTANLKSTTDELGNGWWIGLLSTPLPMAGTTLLLAARWQTIPARISIHWGLDGRPNGWAERGIGSIFGLLFASFFMVIVFGVIGELIARSSPGHEGRTAVIRTTRSVLLACAWMVTILFCGTSLLPLTHDPSRLISLVAIVPIVFSMGMLGFVVFRWMQMPEAVAAAQDSTDPRFWKAGIVYYNREDSALWVPKRFGFGYSLNFGRPVSWMLLGLILLVPFAIHFFVHASTVR
ncbi:DUF5808 domain-containing protein [Tunturibacter psychrotolerans]|uniref:DUF5808 domain-containing protein n=1 Tax=Tunturiibacter psychrotolerans TaxID=3069686 RepID=A0AAU7ZKW2_9BACT